MFHKDTEIFKQDNNPKFIEERLKQIENIISKIKDKTKKSEAFLKLGERAHTLILPGLAYRAFSQVEKNQNKEQYETAQLGIAQLYIGRQILLDGQDVEQSLNNETKETAEQLEKSYQEKTLYHLLDAGNSDLAINLRTSITNQYLGTASVGVGRQFGDFQNREDSIKMFQSIRKSNEAQKEIEDLNKRLAIAEAENKHLRERVISSPSQYLAYEAHGRKYRGEKRQGDFGTFGVETSERKEPSEKQKIEENQGNDSSHQDKKIHL